MAVSLNMSWLMASGVVVSVALKFFRKVFMFTYVIVNLGELI